MALAGGAIGAASLSLSLSGCGSSTGSSNSKEPAESNLYKPVDTTASAKSGGAFRDFQASDVQHFDALASNVAGTVNNGSVFAYPRLLKYTTATYPKQAEGAVEGDAMESYELSPDELTVTFKVRQGVKWDSRAPTSGRALDAEDVLFSWKKYSKVNASAQDIAYEATNAPAAPVESLSAPRYFSC